MPWVGFEPTIPVFEWAKTVHALDRTAIVIGFYGCTGIFYTLRELLNLFRFLLLQYSLIGTLSNVQNFTFRWHAEMGFPYMYVLS
jgi:hypothetical protein